jgi:hypothetical protein
MCQLLQLIQCVAVLCHFDAVGRCYCYQIEKCYDKFGYYNDFLAILNIFVAIVSSYSNDLVYGCE